MAMWPSSGQLSNSKCLVGCSLAFCFPGRVNGHHRQCLFFPSWRLPAVCRGGSWVTTGGKCRGITVMLSWHRWIAKPPFRLPLTWAEQIAGSSCSSLGFCSLQPKAFLTAKLLSRKSTLTLLSHCPEYTFPKPASTFEHRQSLMGSSRLTPETFTWSGMSIISYSDFLFCDSAALISCRHFYCIVCFFLMRGNFQRARLAKLNWSENPCL